MFYVEYNIFFTLEYFLKLQLSGCNTLEERLLLGEKQKIGTKNSKDWLKITFNFILPIYLILPFNLSLNLLTCTEGYLCRSLLLENRACLRVFIAGKDNKNKTWKCWGRIFSKWEGSILPGYFPKCSNIHDYLWQCKQQKKPIFLVKNAESSLTN